MVAIGAREKSKGELVAMALRGAWRETPTPLDLGPEELEVISTILLRSGAAGLVWWRASRTGFALSQLPESFLNAYKLQTLYAAVHLRNVKKAFSVLGSAGLEAVLVKGWAIARRYPQAGLRPYGDLDICIRPEQFKLAREVLRESDAKNIWIDLHQGFGALDREGKHDVFGCTSVNSVGGVAVRVPSEEDHLRILCLHLLRHGAWRPLWLCDIALMVESIGSAFDWDRCLSGKRKHADWIACVIGLAHQLLGADVGGTPVERRAHTLPRWLTTAVLKQWEKGSGMSLAENLSFSLPRRLRNPRAFVSALREHWRNPVQASVEMNAWFSGAPRLPLQFGSALKRTPRVARYFGKEIRQA